MKEEEMSSSNTNLLGTVMKGLVAGAAGTLAMDLLWYSRYQRGGGEDGFLDWEFSASTTNFDDAGAPAQVGKRLVHGLFGKTLPDKAAPLTNNVVHWATGTQWGALYGATAGSTDAGHPMFGLVLGPVAWGTAYAMLGAAKIYKPMWEYDSKTLAQDLSAHLVFGVTTAAVFRALRRR
jgi:hypothetical protein